MSRGEKYTVYRVTDTEGRSWDGSTPGSFGTYPHEFSSEAALKKALKKYFVYHAARIKKTAPPKLVVTAVEYVAAEKEKREVEASASQKRLGILSRTRHHIPNHILEDARDIEKWAYLVSCDDNSIVSPEVRLIKSMYRSPVWYVAYNFAGLFILKSKTKVKRTIDIAEIEREDMDPDVAVQHK